MTRFRRFLNAAEPSIVVAVVLLLSYAKLVELAERAGYGEPMTWLWPLAIDGVTLTALRATQVLTEGRRFAWALAIAGTVISALAAVLAAFVPPGPLPPFAVALVTIIPPLCAPFAMMLARRMRDAATPEDDATLAASDVPADADDATDVSAHEVVSSDAHLEAAGCDNSSQQPRRDLTQTEAADAVLFDLARDAPARRARRGSVTPEQRDKVLRLAATTTMSGREIGAEACTSEASVRRIVDAAGGRDALRADAAHALATVGATA